jgi:hypothetical protein
MRGFSIIEIEDETITCARLLGYGTALVNQELLQNEYLAAENRIFKFKHVFSQFGRSQTANGPDAEICFFELAVRPVFDA